MFVSPAVPSFDSEQVPHPVQVCLLVTLLLSMPPDAKPISRVDAIHQGVSRNYDLLARRLEQHRLEILGRAAWRSYSPNVFLDATYRQTPYFSGPNFVADRFVDYTAGAGWRSIIGTTVAAAVVVNQDVGGNTPLTNELSLSVSQPLLKDAWLAGGSLPLREADLLAAVQKEIYRGEINTLIASIDSAYWDLALAESDLQIKTRSRDRAKQQYEDTKENIRRGIIADVEIYIVEENVVFFEQELLRTDQSLRFARRRLAELLALDPETILDAEDELVSPSMSLPDRQPTVDVGLQQSPVILAQAKRTQLAAVRFRYAWNQALPTLNVNAGMKLFRYPSPEANVGLTLAVPLDRGAISASVENARIDNERAEVELRNQQARVQFELENNITDLELNVRLLSLATKRVELAELKLGAQNDKYKNGISTLADVVRFQRDLDEALIASQRVIRAVHVGRAKLLTTQGTLANTVGVAIQ